MAENLTPKKYIDGDNMKQILTAVKNEISNDNSIITTEAEYLALPEEEKLNNSYYLYDIGVHYKNGVAYSRKEPIQLTMEEYKALGEVDPDQEYIVSADEQGILLGAEDIGYNNAESGIQATTVQGAIDKVVKTVEDKVDKTDIATTLSNASTDTQVPSAKATWDALTKEISNVTILTTADEVNSFDRAYQGFMIPSTISEEVGLPISPNSSWFCIHLSHTNGFAYPSQIAFEYAGAKRIMYRISVKGVWISWMKVCTTSVADIPLTEITAFEYENYVKPTSGRYMVKDGICNITFETVCIASTNTFQTILSGLPKPRARQFQNVVDMNMQVNTGARGVFLLTSDGRISVVCNYGDNTITDTRKFSVSFSYPVKES